MQRARERLARELGDRASARAHDVTSEADWHAVADWALETHGRIDVLVNNAGVFLAAALAETSLEDFRAGHRRQHGRRRSSGCAPWRRR